MDAISFGTYFLIKRLNLRSSPASIKSELCQAFAINPSTPPLQGLILRFNGHRHLVPALGSWIYCDDYEKLAAEDVTELLGNGTIHNMATRIFTSTSTLTSALADLIPALIKKAAINGELNHRRAI